MTIAASDCCVLNAGNGAWAFDALAQQLADALWVDVSEEPRQYNYVLFTDAPNEVGGTWFIPHEAMVLASDKRSLAEAFAKHQVPAPRTWLVEQREGILALLWGHPELTFCLKYPLACGAFGHRMLTQETVIPNDWPQPFIVQEFINVQPPEVLRTYGAGGALFGWIARRFPQGAKTSPWVAHARGARYQSSGELPADARVVAAGALQATGLLDSFGCVDLLQRADGSWVALEVGTDGLFNHVDRALDDPVLEREIQRRVAEAFWERLGYHPWGNGAWHLRSEGRSS